MLLMGTTGLLSGFRKKLGSLFSLAQPLTSYRSSILLLLSLSLFPLLLGYLFFNIYREASILIAQNTVVLVSLATSIRLLMRGRYTPASLVLFLVAFPLVQLSFIVSDLYGSTIPGMEWRSFILIHSSLTVFFAAAFLPKLRYLLFTIVLICSITVVHIVYSVLDGRFSLFNYLGLFCYFLVAIAFSFLINQLFRVLDRLLQDQQRRLDEKNRLIRDVHHRIKNHMYSVSSTLSLQAMEFDDPRVLAAFEESRQRIRIMQSIYEKLYTNDSYRHLPIGVFINSLVNDLSAAYIHGNCPEVKKEIQEFHISSVDSYAIGLIVTELFSNSVKYAFPQARAGSIFVGLALDYRGGVCIRVEDDGVGIANELTEPGQYGFGLMLVHSYVQQLHGSMQIDNDHGTKISVQLGLTKSSRRDTLQSII